MRKISITAVAALAVVSAQASTITFDEPGHAHGTSVNGINGWTSVGNENTYNSVPIVGGSDLVLYSDGLNDGRATKEITSDIAGITTVSFVFKNYSDSGTAALGEFSITSGDINLANGENVGAAMWLWIDGQAEAAGANDHNFRVYGSGAGAPTTYNYVGKESYRFTATLNYNTGQITSSSLEDLSGSLGTQSSSTPIDFYTATTLAEAQAKTSVVIGGAGRTGFDNIETIPEPATLGLLSALGAGLMFIRRLFMI